jgi:hypothetical protein
MVLLIRAGNESGAGSAVAGGCGCLVFVSVAGSRGTTLCASLENPKKQRQEPARALMAGDLLVRYPEIDSYDSHNLGNQRAEFA